MIDIDLIKYDFRLDSLSTAIGKAKPNADLPNDRLGIRRDEEPDIGCYECWLDPAGTQMIIR